MYTVRDRHEELLVRLHHEMRAGRGDEDQANQIRDEMDRVWAELDDDRELMDALSEDLYLIEGKRVVTPFDEGETVDSIWARIAIAFKEGRDREALAQIRKLSELGSQHAYVVGRCWERLGFRRGAVCFYDFAYEQQRKAVYAVSVLEALVHSDQMQEAVRRVDEIENRLIVDATLALPRRKKKLERVRAARVLGGDIHCRIRKLQLYGSSSGSSIHST